MKTLYSTLFTLLVVMQLLVDCSAPTAVVDPGGSEITNGKVVAMDGARASGINVAAYPQKYIAGNSDTALIVKTVTGADGAFELAIDSGLYNIFIIDTMTRSGSCIRNIGPKTDLGTIRLDSLGSIAGTVRIDSARAVPLLIIYSRGTPMRVNIASSDGLFRFSNVPAGAYTLSIAQQPPTGCIPGEDCLPGGVGSEGGLGSVTVEAGTTAAVDTLVNAGSIGRLP